MKATGIVRRIDDLGRVVIPKEIRRTMRIREGDPSQTTLENWQKFSFSMLKTCTKSFKALTALAFCPQDLLQRFL